MSGEDSGLTSGSQVTVEQGTIENKVKTNEANVASTFDVDRLQSNSSFADFPKTINVGKQGKHIPGHNNYQKGKSSLTISMAQAESLVQSFSGLGDKINNNKERVDFGTIIGNYRDPTTGEIMPTSVGIIHYSQSGTHIVPARPRR